MRYTTAPAYDPRSGMYRGKGDGSKGKRIPKSGAIKTVGQYKTHHKNGSASPAKSGAGSEAKSEARAAANGDPRKKSR